MLDRSSVMDRIEAENARLLDGVRSARTRRVIDNDLAHAFAAGVITRGSGCDRKVPYRTLEYAQGVSARVSARFGHRQTPYFCNWCHQYHLCTDKD